MNIIHVAEPFASGIAVFVKSLTDTMKDDTHFIVHGERPEVISFKEVKKQFSLPNVRFIRWRSAQRSISFQKDSAAFIELYTILRRLKKKFRIDAVHLHSSKSGFIGRAVCNILHIQNVIYTPNGAPFLIGNNSISNFLYKQLEKFGDRMGGKVVCCSESEMEAYRNLGINASFVNNGIETSTFNGYRPQLEAKSAGRFRVVTSGRIIHQKHPELFNTIATYFKDLAQFEFIWIGDGPDIARLESPNISITGWIDQESAYEIISTADMYLSTARFEGLPFAVIEALALKKPVLLTDCVGNRDLVKSGLNGDLYTTAELGILKLLQYYNNTDMLDVMGANSANYCQEDFNMHNSYRQYKNYYRRQSTNITY